MTETDLDESKLDNRGLLILLNERYKNLHGSIHTMTVEYQVYYREFIALKIEVEKIKTTGRIYTAIIGFVAGIASALITALILKK